MPTATAMPLPLFAENEPLNECQTKIWSKAPMPAAHTEAQIMRIALVISAPHSFSSVLRRRSPSRANLQT